MNLHLKTEVLGATPVCTIGANIELGDAAHWTARHIKAEVERTGREIREGRTYREHIAALRDLALSFGANSNPEDVSAFMRACGFYETVYGGWQVEEAE